MIKRMTLVEDAFLLCPGMGVPVDDATVFRQPDSLTCIKTGINMEGTYGRAADHARRSKGPRDYIFIFASAQAGPGGIRLLRRPSECGGELV